MAEVTSGVKLDVLTPSLLATDGLEVAPKAEDLTCLSLADSHNLFEEVRKTENVISAIFTTRAINTGASKLLEGVIASPTPDQKVEAVLITKAFNNAKRATTFIQALAEFNTSLSESRSRFMAVLPKGFNPNLVKEQTKDLFLYFAREEGFSSSQIQELTELTCELTSEQDLLALYTSDEKCQAKTKSKLLEIKKELIDLEKPARELKAKKLDNLSKLDREVRRLDQAYQTTAARVDTLLEKMSTDSVNFTGDEEAEYDALSEKVETHLDDLLGVTKLYDLATDFQRYLNQHVAALEPNLERINELKIEFKDLQASFIEAKPSKAQTDIITLETTPRLNDTTDPLRFPSLRPISKVFSSLKEAIENKQTTMSFRVFYELEQFVSPVEGYASANQALSMKIEELADAEVDANQVFSDFFNNPEGRTKDLILKALTTFLDK